MNNVIVILYYTNGLIPLPLREFCWRKLQEVKGECQVVAVSPDDPGKGCAWVRCPFMPVISPYSVYATMLAGLDTLPADAYVATAEHDCLYPPGFFASRNCERGQLAYQTNILRLNENGFFPYTEGGNTFSMLSNLSGYAGEIRDILHRRLANISSGRKNYAWCEPDEIPIVRWAADAPMVDIRHGGNCTGGRVHPKYWPSATHWGAATDILLGAKVHRTHARIDDGPRLIRTCMYGSYASQFAPTMLATHGYKYVIHTDGRTPVLAKASYYRIAIDPAPEGNPRHASRRFKFHSDAGYAWSIYHDDNITVTEPDALIAWCQRLPADVYFFSHNKRHCLYEEAEYCRLCGHFKGAELAQAWGQMAAYRDAGYPHNAGLYELGLFVVRNSGRMDDCMADIRAEYKKWQPCPNDQLATPFVLWQWRDRVRPARLPGTVYRNEFSVFHDRPHVEAK